MRKPLTQWVPEDNGPHTRRQRFPSKNITGNSVCSLLHLLTIEMRRTSGKSEWFASCINPRAPAVRR